MCMICAQRNPSDLLARIDQHLATGGVAPSAANPGSAFWQGFGGVYEVVDLAASPGTTATLINGQSAYGTLDAGTDADWFRIDLVAGQTYDFRLLGFGVNMLADPLLQLMDSAGNLLASNDDGFTLDTTVSNLDIHELDSRMIFTAPTTGTYYLVADNFATATGDYLLSAAPYNPNGMIFTVDEIAWQLINPGNGFFDPTTEAAAFNVGADGALTVNITGLTAAGQYLAQQALQSWTLVTGITFQYVSGAAEITFVDTASGAFAQPLYSGSTITSSTVNIGLDWLSGFGTTLDSYSFESYIHEIGHALGLGHPGNYNGSAIYGTDNYYLNDSAAWSIMSYIQAFNDEFDFGAPGDVNDYVGAGFRYIFTPQIADIIAIQYLYGDTTAVFTGSTTYGYNSNTGITAIDGAVNSGSLMAMTVYDDGGTDTLDFSGYNAFQTITLFQESLSSVLGGIFNLGIARGTVIENAIGGSGADDIYGNEVANTLEGRNGIDYLYGGGGNDVLIGGAGADRLIGGDGTRDRVQYSDSTVGLRVDLQVASTNTGIAAGDTFTTVEDIYGSAFGDTLMGNAGGNMIWAAAGNDVIYGRAGADTIYGGEGNDVLGGGDGADVLDGGAGTHDRAQYSDAIAGVRADLQSAASNTGLATGDSYTGIEDLHGSAFSDALLGNSGGNAIWGWTGNDVIYGRAGADTIYGGEGNDVLGGGDGADVLDGGAGARDRAQYSDAIAGVRADLQSAGSNTGWAAGDSYTGIEDLHGSAFSDALLGNAGGNAIWGWTGSDAIYGRAGADTVYGGDGNDVLGGNEGNDVLDGGAGRDTFVFDRALGAGNVDQVQGYAVADDTVRLDDAIFTALATGGLSATAFASGAAATLASHRILYDAATGHLSYDADGTGATGPIHFATLSTGLAMTAAEFIVL